MKVILAGGGTGGSVAPLLAIAEEIKEKKPETEFLFIGTKKGEPEREMVKNYDIDFTGITCGKLRRYFSWQNFLDIFRLKLGFWQSLFILKKFKPDLVIGAGGYVSVPVIITGWFLRIPSFILQQDILPTLSNKILAPFAKKIFVSFEPSLKDFPKNKTIFSGQPVRKFIFEGSSEKGRETFKLKKDKPVLVILGGGTGAASLNNLIWQNLKELTKFCQIVHLTGKGKSNLSGEIERDYQSYEFLNKEIADLFATADLVISRAGMNVLSELAVLGKPTIIIPIPDSHQEANARYFQEKNAAIVLNQNELTAEKLLNEIKELINNKERKSRLKENIKKIIPREAVEKITQEIINFINK